VNTLRFPSEFHVEALLCYAPLGLSMAYSVWHPAFQAQVSPGSGSVVRNHAAAAATRLWMHSKMNCRTQIQLEQFHIPVQICCSSKAEMLAYLS